MICQDILAILLLYQQQLSKVIDLRPEGELTFEVSSEYSFITIDMQKGDEQFARIRFEVGDDSAKLYELYCEDQAAADGKKEKITREYWPGWRSSSKSKLPFGDEIIQSIQTADRIAALTANCTKGDDYRPGNFSKVFIDGQRIELQQINLMHAKSSAHKDDYMMRKLVFKIPLQEDTQLEKRYGARKIGNMIVEFSDTSSKKNKECGKRIAEELDKIAGD